MAVSHARGAHGLVEPHPSPKLLTVRPHHLFDFVMVALLVLLDSISVASSLWRYLGPVRGAGTSLLVGVGAGTLPPASMTLVAST